MKKLIRSLCLAVAIGVPGIAVATPIISVEPTVSTGLVGDSLFVDIMWDGSMDPEYLSAWDIDLFFDSSILAFMDAVIDPEFGVDSISCDLCGFSDVSPGVVDMFAVSFEEAADVVFNQDSLGNQFVMATVEFMAIAEGSTNVSFGGQSLTFGDEAGDALSPQLANGRVCIGPNGCTTSSVPEPAAAALLLSGLALLRLQRTKKH